LGSADGSSASEIFIQGAVKTLSASEFAFSHNHPFKGGFITRNYGKPVANVHALQLEMTKLNYMDDRETAYDEIRARRMQVLLRRTLSRLAETALSP
jgi:N-formylglutamate deformylase